MLFVAKVAQPQYSYPKCHDRKIQSLNFMMRAEFKLDFCEEFKQR